MKRMYLFMILIIMVLVAAPSNAETPDATAIIKKTKGAWDIRPISFKVIIIVKKGERITGKMIAGATYKRFSEDRRLLIVFLEPQEAKGVSYLLHSLDNGSTEQWIYLPYIDRVRKLDGLNSYESFFGTDFTFTDLRLIDTQSDIFKYIGEEEIGGVKAYKIESSSKKPNYYYSKIINWIAKDTFQILRRDFYSPNKSLWKKQFFENLTVINGMPIPLRIRMLDLQHKTSTEINISEADAALELPNEIFLPDQLKYSLKCPVWQKVCYPHGISEKNNKPVK